MPSGAKKRKAAKKKLQKNENNSINNNGSHSNSQGSEDLKTHDERKNDGVVVETEENVEGRNVEASVHADDVGQNGKNKSSSSSSSGSGSSSDDDDKSNELELGKVETSVDIAVVEESIPREESVKHVVPLPQVSTIASGNVTVDNSLTSDVIESGSQQSVEQIERPFNEKIIVVSGVEKNKDGCCKSTCEPECVTARDDDGLLPQSSGVKAVEECYVGDEGKSSETQKFVEEQPLLPFAPMPVRRTSWMDCCGLFEVFSGESRR